MHSIAQTPLTSVEYHITGTSLQVTPAVLSVPTGIPGSILPLVESGGSTNNAAVAQLTSGAYVQAIIRGPSFPTPQTLVAAPNSPLLLPPLNLVGDYELDNIALVDAASGATRLEGSPSSVPVHVFDQLLISSVTSQPMTLDQIQQAGIAIDESSFRAVQFNVSFVLNGQTIPVSFPVVSPTFIQSTELIPADQVQASLAQAAAINQQIASTMVQLPPQLQTAGLNIQMQGINFQVVDPSAGQSLSLAIPPIPALMVIPGNIGYLHEFFSVKLFTENGAPTGSGLSVGNIQATLELPPGPDGVVSTNWAQPGDDPLRFARIGPNQIVQPTQPVVDPGPDGTLGDSDDISVLQPGETGQAQFLVEGLQEGLAVMNINLTGDLYGLAAGTVHIQGKAAGSVLVRNPDFSITFTHPDVVRVGEPYTASITVLNTGVTPANLVQITLNKNSISGAILDTNQPETIQLGTILPGQSAIATYRMIAERTGQITFSDLTTGDNSVTGQFLFSMGVDAQGVPLSPDTIAMPDFVNNLPSNLVFAANRVLGQALSIATAAQLPPGIVPVNNAIITRRVLDLVEAGQRVQYGDPLNRVLPDLLRDWQGGRVADDGFDSLVRTSDAGAQWRAALFTDMEADSLDGTQRALNRAPDLAGLGQQFVLASASLGQLRGDFTGGTNSATSGASSQPYAMVYDGTNGEWAVTPDLTNAVFTWTFTNGPPQANMAVLIFGTNGQAQRFTWQVPSPPVTAVYRFALADPSQQLQVDTNGDGTVDLTLPPNQSIVHELPPTIIAVQQDLTVVAGRPSIPCVGPSWVNYGTVVAVVYSKPMTQATAGSPASYTVEGDNGADSVQIQPSGRVALLNLRKGVSAIIPRKLTATGVTDVRGNPLAPLALAIQSFYPGTTNLFTGGVAIKGRVLEGDGLPSVGVPVTLTMHDGAGGGTCMPITRRVSQVVTDSGGNFSLDFVMSGIPYTVSATDTSGLSSNALSVIMQSIVSTQPDPTEFQQLLSASTNAASLLSLLSAGSVAQALAVVQGLDRAVFNDAVGLGSGREGQTVPVVIRFRGRGTVTGQVLASDGITPIPNAAVNLFPDPSSLELGSGMFADGSGQFSFPGVPLGVFTVQVATSDGRGATALGILQSPDETTNIVISLPDNPVLYGDLRGQVFDSDNVTPVPNAKVYIGRYGGTVINNVTAILTADENGFWDATNTPIQTWDVVAVTFDGSRKGVRTGITPVATQPTYVNIALQAATTVFGQVQFDNGQPVPNALVAGGTVLVTTDTNGNFQLQGVPVGNSVISAGLARNPAAGIDFPRLGSALANVVAGTANYVVVKLNAAGRIFGQVFDAQGNPQPNIRVAIPDPQGGGFYWTIADTNGNYAFENMGLGGYTVSAPASAVAPQLNTSQLGQQVSSGNEAQILAAFNEAVTVFVGSEDPLINGEGLNFLPSAWGYTTASLDFDGANVNADIHFIPQGSIFGKVLNGQGIPIGAEVELTGLGPDPTGAPVVTVRGTTTSDPATGQFGFTNILLAGPWELQAASPFYQVVIKTNGFTTELNPNVSGVVLQFPPVNDVNGSIAGHVYNPDGTLVSQGAQVHINVSSDYQILTDTNGFFDTQTEFPAVGVTYEVDVFDPASGLQGRNLVAMTPGITNFVDVHLLTRNSTVQVKVLQAGGMPAAGAQLELDQGSFPFDAPLFAVTDTNGMAVFSGLWEGSYAVMGQYTEASTKLFSRGGVSVGANQTATITLTMGATGAIQGTFVQQDMVTPVYGAEVAIGNLGFATTDTNGFFNFQGVPLGNYSITSSDPVTGGNAVSSATLTFNGQTQTVQLVEATLGDVSGLVMDSYNTGFVAGASVTISFSDGVTPGRTVTTTPNGAFNFPGSPMGSFHLSASYHVPGTLKFIVNGQANGVLSPSSTNDVVNIQLQPLSYLEVQVYQSDGTTPASNALVSVNGTQQNTSTNGTALFTDLMVPANYGVTAVSEIGGDLFDGAQTNVTLTANGTNSSVKLVLPGVGSVVGTVAASDGSTPVNNAQVTLQFQSPLFQGQSEIVLTDPQGHFAFSDVPLGAFNISAVSQSLAAAQSGALSAGGQTNQVTLQLGGSGTLLGVVVRADGVTPVAGVPVSIQFQSQSANAGAAVVDTDTNGGFQFSNVPIGRIHVTASDPAISGVINFTIALTNNSEVLNLGNIAFDEDLPQVVQVTPPNGAVQIPITNDVVLLFNEALDTNSISPSGIFIEGTNGIVNSSVTLLPDTNGVLDVVRITPDAPLQSLNTYEVVVLSGDVPGPNGNLLGSGPLDSVGRAMAAPFGSQFTTADNTPPQLLSIFPSNNAVQIDPTSVPRLVFNKYLNSTSFVFTVTGPNGPVAGTASIGLNGQVLTFLPTANLSANATYSMTVSNVFDLVGNAAVGQPYTATFATIVTVGPAIASLSIASNAPPTGGAVVPIQAVLATNKPGDSVSFTQDFNPVGTATNAPYTAMVKLPTSGSTTIRAIATDQYGNAGQFTQLVITVQAALPPTVQFALVSPTNGVVPTGSSFVVKVNASADTSISNFTGVAAGAATGPLVSTNGTELSVEGFVPTNAIAGQQAEVFAQAIDALGLSSGEQVFSLPIRDATPPELAIASPANGALFNPGDVLNLAALTSDNSSNVTLNVSIFGSVSATQSVVLALTPNTPVTNLFLVPLTNTSPLGGPFTARLTATDAATNTTVASGNFQLRGPPPSVQLTRVGLTNGPVPSGSILRVDVNTTSGNGIAQLTADVTGAVTNLVTTNATSIQLQIPVPATALAGEQLQIVAQATDTLGQSSGPQTLVLLIADGTPPSLTVSGPTNNTLFLSGQELDLSAVTSDNSSNETLSLVLSGSVSATQTVALALRPNVLVTNFFAVTLTNIQPLGGPFTATVMAADAATNTTVVTRTYQLKGPGPTLQFTAITPAGGPVPSGSTFVAEIAATSGNGIAQLTASVTGAITNGPITTLGSSLLLRLPVPATALAGAQFTISAEASDTLGRSSGVQTFTLAITDGTPPVVVILSPPDGTHLSLGQPLDLAVVASDNSSNATLTLTLSGSVAASQTAALSLVPNLPVTNVFIVPLTNPLPNGGLLTATVGAMDAAGNSSPMVTRSFWLPPTQTNAVTWDRQALGQTFACTNGGGTYTWPNNNNWSQAEVLGQPCGAGPLLAVQPSNWSTTNYPDGSTNDVLLGSLGGAPANLDVSVIINILTIQSNGGLNLELGTTLTASAFDFQGDSGISVGGGGGASPAFVLNPGGTITKSGGLGAFVFAPAVALSCLDGTIAVASGTLALPGGNSLYSNVTLTASANAVLDLVPTNNNVNFAGTLNGSGAGQVQLNYGSLIGGPVTLDFAPGLFNWMGGRMNDLLTNVGGLTILATGTNQLWDNGGIGTEFYNAGLVQQAAGTLDLQDQRVNFNNLAPGVYDFTGDGNVVSTLAFGTGTFDNEGLVRKSGGTSSAIAVPFNNLGGSLEVDSGTLSLSGGGSGSGGSLSVNAASVLEFTGGTWTWSGNLTGTGGGQVQFSSGVMVGNPVTLHFAPGMLQWVGDRMNDLVTNVGALTLISTNTHQLWDNGGIGTEFYNAGLVQHAAGTLDLQDQRVNFENLSSGVYDFTGDGSIISTLAFGTGAFDNQGLVRKTGGTNSIIGVPFNNNGGSIEVDSGTLSLTTGNYAQNGGGLKVALGGLGAGQSGQLAVTGQAALSGSLNVVLSNGFVPAPGDQFMILTSAGISGFFNPVSVPAGFLLRYTNGTVVLVFTGQANPVPTLQFTQVFPTNGPAPSAAPFEVDLSASDPDGIVQVSASVSGAVTNSFITNGSFLRITGIVPPTAIAGEQVQIVAQALDNLGQSTGPQVLSLPVSDGTPPQVAILSPAGNTLLPLAQPLNLATLVADNSTNVTLRLVTSGSLTSTQTVAVALVPNLAATNIFTVSLSGADQAGGMMTAAVTATDAAGNASTNTQTYWLPPFTPTALTWQQWSANNFPSSTAYQVTLGGGSFTYNNSATIGTLIIQPDGALNLSLNGPGSSLTAENFDFQGDGSITRSGCCGPSTLNLVGGTMEKTGGTNTFSIDPGITLNSFNGTLAADAGTLALPGGNSTYTDGALQAASNATLVLVPSGNTANFAGMFTGSGSGTVAMSAGKLSAASGGVTFDLPAGLFQWSGGTIAGPGILTNAGSMELPGTNQVDVSGMMANSGTLLQTGAGGLGLDSGPSSRFENLAGGTYELESGASIVGFGCCGPVGFDNFGTFTKVGSLSNAVVAVPFDNLGGLVDVETGTLTLANNGTSSNGTYSVGAGAVLDLTGGQSPTWAGLMNGQGAGAAILSTGVLRANPSLALNFGNGLFNWSGGQLAGVATNLGVLMVSGASDSGLSGQLFNSGLIRQVGSGRLGLDNGPSSILNNLPGGIYQFETDSSLYSFGCCGAVGFENDGLVRKSGGTNVTTIGINFNNLGGTVEADTGTLVLANNGTSSNGTFSVATGATVDLTGGAQPTWAGALVGNGTGTLQLSGGQLDASSLVLDCTNGLFQWTGGTISGTVLNTNTVTISGTNSANVSGRMLNSGLVVHSGSGGLGLDSGPSSRFENLGTGTYELESGASIFAFGCCGSVGFDNFGTFTKLGSLSNAVVSVLFDNLGGLVDVETGTLTLANNGTSSNGTYSVAAGAVLDLTGGQGPTWAGLMNGQGAGAAVLGSGILNASPSVALNFANGMFNWDGGLLRGLATNLDVLMVSGSADSELSGQMFNSGLIRHVGTGRLGLDAGPSTVLHNLPGGIYQFEADSSLFSFGCCGTVGFENDGLVRKSAGTNVTTIGINFNNLGGTVEADTGTLVLANSGSSSNGTFNVAAGATVDLTGGAAPAWAGVLGGTGAGTLQLSSGQLNASSLVLNCTTGLFQWTGGTISGTVINTNVVTISGTNSANVSGRMLNSGLVVHSGTGGLGLDSGPSSRFENLVGGTYELESGAGIFGYSCCGSVGFDNFGTVKKTGNTNTVAISVPFNNQNGSIEVDSGVLSLGSSSYTQGTGGLTIQLAGTNVGQFGQLSAGTVSLGGPLHLQLQSGFAPAIGTQFQIVTCSSLTGTFSSLDVPTGISINYSAGGVVAVVTGQIAALQAGIGRPTLTIFKASPNGTTLKWQAGSNFVLESTTQLIPSPLWLPVTNLPTMVSSNVFQLTLPGSNTAQYFRLRQH